MTTPFSSPWFRSFKTFYLWTGLAVVFSVSVCGVISWLRFEQSNLIFQSERILDGISQARIDLADGFLDTTIGGGPQSPFRKRPGLALLDQAITSLQRVKNHELAGRSINLLSQYSWKNFNKTASAFRSELAAWNQTRGAARDELALRLHHTFHQLDRFATQIDTASQIRLRKLNLDLDRTFEFIIIVSALLLCGMCVGVYVAGRDQSRAIKAMRESESKLRVIGDNLPDGYVYQYARKADGTPAFNYISAGVERVHGLAVDDCLRDANCLLTLIDPSQIAEYNAAVEASVKNFADFEMDIRFRHPDGRNRVVHARSHPIRTENDQIVWDGLVVDVTSHRHAEAKLRKNEALLNQMGRTAKVGGWEFDVISGEGEWTEEVARIHGVDPGISPNKAMGLAVYQGESRRRIEAAVNTAIEDGTSYNLELEMVTAKGEHKWVHTIGHPVVEDGKVVRLRGSFQDITDLKEAETALREREQQLRLFVEHSPAAIAMFDTQMRYLMVSRRWLADYRLEGKTILGRSHYEVFPEIPQRWKESHRRCLQGAVEKCDADPFPRADGSRDWVRWAIHPWYNDDQAIGGLILITEVITQQKDAEEALRRQQQNYREIFNATSDAIFLHDAATGEVLDANDSALEMYGYASKQEILADNFRKTMGAQSAYDWEEAWKRMRLAVEQGPQVFDWLGRKINGALLWVEVALRSAEIDGQLRVLAVVRDISQRKAHEIEIERLTRLYATLSQVNQIIVRCQTREELFGEICRVMIEFGKLRGVWIGWRNNEKAALTTMANRLSDADTTASLPGWTGQCGVHEEMLRTAAPVFCNDLSANECAACCRDLIPSLGIQSCGAFPLRFRGGVHGAFSICSTERNFFTTEEVRLLEEIAGDISYALERLAEREDRKRAEAALLANRAILDAALASMSDAVFVTDPQGRLIEFNDAFASFHKFKNRKQCAKTLAEYPDIIKVFAADDGLIPVAQWPVSRALRGDVGIASEYDLRRVDTGDTWSASYSFAPIRNAQKAIVGAVVVARDITQQKRAETALRDSERIYRSLFESSQDAIATIDLASGCFTTANPAALRIFGAQTMEDLLARTPQEFSPERQPDGRLSQAVASELTEKVLREGPQSFEWLHCRLNGEEFLASVLLTLIEWRNESFFMGTIRDITESKRMEAALTRSELNFRTTFETAAVGMAQADLGTGRFRRVNRRMCEITGFTPEELTTMRFSDITHPDDRAEDWAAFQRVMDSEAPDYHLEKRYLRKDGSLVWVNVHVTMIRNAAGTPIYSLGVIEDISERKRTEAERVRLTTAMEQAAELIVITDVAGTILYVNPAFEKVTGYSRQEAIGKNPRILKSDRHDKGFYQALWRTLTSGQVWHGRFINKKKNGKFYEEDATISPVRNSAGKIVNYVAVKHDITREVELEAQFRQAQKMEGIGQLAGGVAHDFNNILAAIMLQAKLAETGSGVPLDAMEGMQQIQKSCERAANLTRQLLLFSRKQVMQLREVDLNEIITSITKMLQRIIGENVRIQLNLHPRPLIIHADAGMFDQILLNLAVNGRDAMHGKGNLIIQTSERSVDEEFAAEHPDVSTGRYVCLTVRDTGSGIPPEILSRIFEPFFTTKEQGKGTGLGLATVFGIVKQHHGWIDVETAPHEGTTFKIYVPAKVTTRSSKGDSKNDERRLHGSETVLLVEDDNSVRVITRRFLELHGYTVLEACDGDEALALWDQHRAEIKLLLTDLLMPGNLNGHDVAKHILAAAPDMKVIYFSGYSADLAGRGLELRAGENFLQKPVMPKQLLELVRRRLDA